MKHLLAHTGLLVLASLQLFAGEVEQVVPSQEFQGLWEHKASSRLIALEAGQDHGEWKKKGDKEEIHFRRHESGAIQRVWKNDQGEVVQSRGVTILSLTESKLRFREWSSHPACHTELIIDEDGVMTLIDTSAKHIVKAQLVRTPVKEAEQAGTGQPATRPESKAEGSDKPQPESEGRSR
jgi:hypothetical protein